LSGPETSVTGSYKLTWPAVSGATKYAVYESINANPWELVQFTSSKKYETVGEPVGMYTYVVFACTATTCSSTGSPTHAIFVNALGGPSSDPDGNFSLTWDVEGWSRYAVYMSFNAGPYRLIHFDGTGRLNTYGKRAGTYYFTVGACDDITCAPSTSPVKTITVTGSPPLHAEPLSEQALYEHTLRVGDFDGNGYVDVLVDRKSSSIQDGSLRSFILSQNASGMTAINPSGSLLTTARTYPITTTLELQSTDLNFDMFADIVISGLKTVNTTLVDSHITFAPGEINKPAPMGSRAMDSEFMRFFGDLRGWAVDPSCGAPGTVPGLRGRSRVPGRSARAGRNP
jgi:hypothetical protein